MFVHRANPSAGPRTYFFADDVPTQILYRSLGLSQFNQTLTRCDLDDPRYVRVLTLKHKWIYTDHILPTPGQQQSMQSKAGYGGAGLAMFVQGHYGMYCIGRYAVMQFRQMNEPRLEVVELPNGGFPNALCSTRAVAVYAGSAHPGLAALFLQYLASKTYNMKIVRDGDSLPPVPTYADTAAFLRPPNYPDEWGCAAEFLKAMRHIAIGPVSSPFILETSAARIIKNAQEQYDNGLLNATQAATATAAQIDRIITRNVQRKPELQRLYHKRLQLQKKIDDRLGAREKVPASWISNPFYRQFYKAKGMLEYNTHHKISSAGNRGHS